MLATLSDYPPPPPQFPILTDPVMGLLRPQGGLFLACSSDLGPVGLEVSAELDRYGNIDTWPPIEATPSHKQLVVPPGGNSGISMKEIAIVM